MGCLRSWCHSRIGERIATESLEGGERLIEVGDDDQLDVVTRHLTGSRHVLVGLPGGYEEVPDAGLTDRRDLLGEAADRPDGAVELHRAGDGNVDTAEQVALGELVEQRQGEGQAGTRSPDLPGVEGDLEGQPDGSA